MRYAPVRGDCLMAVNGTRNREGFLVDERGRECSKCGVYKEWEEFPKRGLNPDGTQRYNSHCKWCRCNVFVGKLEGVIGAKAMAYLFTAKWDIP
jgi:hypothetical protein